MSAKLKAKPEVTDDLKTALQAAHGKRLTFKGNTYKVDAYMVHDRFFCYAENLTPKTPEEAKYCLWDVWASESEDGMKLLAKMAELGGYQP